MWGVRKIVGELTITRKQPLQVNRPSFWQAVCSRLQLAHMGLGIAMMVRFVLN